MRGRREERVGAPTAVVKMLSPKLLKLVFGVNVTLNFDAAKFSPAIESFWRLSRDKKEYYRHPSAR